MSGYESQLGARQRPRLDLGVGATFLGASLVTETLPLAAAVALGVASGVAMGCVVGCITGWMLAYLLGRSDGAQAPPRSG